jgi:hypothetical protein
MSSIEPDECYLHSLKLIEKYAPLVTTWDCYWDAKKCALIAVDEILNINEPFCTILGGYDSGEFRHDMPTYFHSEDLIKGGSFPTDYNFLNLKHKYLIGMSVPPVMTAQIAKQVYEQWLSKIN